VLSVCAVGIPDHVSYYRLNRAYIDVTKYNNTVFFDVFFGYGVLRIDIVVVLILGLFHVFIEYLVIPVVRMEIVVIEQIHRVERIGHCILRAMLSGNIIETQYIGFSSGIFMPNFHNDCVIFFGVHNRISFAVIVGYRFIVTSDADIRRVIYLCAIAPQDLLIFCDEF
jgi:hypothetical protein